jgi:hypothetical protein
MLQRNDIGFVFDNQQHYMGGGGHLFALFEERGIFIDCCGRKSQVFV